MDKHQGVCATLLSSVLLMAPAVPAPAQETEELPEDSCDELGWLDIPELVGPAAEFARAAEIVGSAPLRTRLLRRPVSHTREPVCAEAEIPWRDRLRVNRTADNGLALFPRPLSMAHHLNTRYPNDRNNGAVWAGRGLASSISGGFDVRWGHLSGAFQPVVAYQENRSFEISLMKMPGFSRMIYHGHPMQIDWPQRFGETSFWTFHPGQSHLRIDVQGVATGLSTENLWWGPALRNPILLSNTAPGFPHAFIRTSQPLDIRIGHLEAEMIWGGLRQSEYFTANAAEHRRLAGGAIVVLRPRIVDGLSVGAARMHISNVPPYGITISEAILTPYGGGASANAALQMSTLFARLVLTESAFEIYGEMALPDYDWGSGATGATATARRDRGAAWVVGAVKVVPLESGWLRLYGELFQLQNEISLANDLPTRTYYIHPEVRQGYTHAGQLLGAGVGPGSEAQIVGADFYTGWGSLGLIAERVGYDDDAYYAHHAHRYGFHGFDVEVSVGVRQTLFVGPVQLDWTLTTAQRRNRSFIIDRAFLPERNWTFSIGSSWLPGS